MPTDCSPLSQIINNKTTAYHPHKTTNKALNCSEEFCPEHCLSSFKYFSHQKKIQGYFRIPRRCMNPELVKILHISYTIFHIVSNTSS